MELWRDIIDSLNGGLLVVSPQLEILASNPAAEALLGSQISPGLLRAMIVDNRWFEQALRNCLDGRTQEISYAESNLIVGGRSFPLRCEISTLVNREGNAAGAVLMLHDLSHHEMVSNAGRPLGLSPTGLAHEIKNPLTGIKGAAELLTGLFPTDERIREYTGIIIGGVDRIAGLVEQVLAVGGGAQGLRQEPVNIHQILHGALRMAGLFPQTEGSIRIEQVFDPSLPEVYGDPAALERVFLNLIRNAIEAIGSGPGVIRLRTKVEDQFRVRRGKESRQLLRVEVTDSGKGLSAAEQAQLFTPFFTTKPNGNGLGLVLSQRVVVLHGGSLSAYRSKEESLTGMTFRVNLPFAAGR